MQSREIAKIRFLSEKAGISLKKTGSHESQSPNCLKMVEVQDHIKDRDLIFRRGAIPAPSRFFITRKVNKNISIMQNAKQSDSGWGGARAGSGRKKTSARSIALRIPADVAEILDSVQGSKSAYIVEAIRAYHAASLYRP